MKRQGVGHLLGVMAAGVIALSVGAVLYFSPLGPYAGNGYVSLRFHDECFYPHDGGQPLPIVFAADATFEGRRLREIEGFDFPRVQAVHGATYEPSFRGRVADRPFVREYVVDEILSVSIADPAAVNVAPWDRVCPS